LHLRGRAERSARHRSLRAPAHEHHAAHLAPPLRAPDASLVRGGRSLASPTRATRYTCVNRPAERAVPPPPGEDERPSPEAAGASAPAATPGRAPRVAYIMSRFPKITETFVLYEMK